MRTSAENANKCAAARKAKDAKEAEKIKNAEIMRTSAKNAKKCAAAREAKEAKEAEKRKKAEETEKRKEAVEAEKREKVTDCLLIRKDVADYILPQVEWDRIDWTEEKTRRRTEDKYWLLQTPQDKRGPEYNT